MAVAGISHASCPIIAIRFTRRATNQQRTREVARGRLDDSIRYQTQACSSYDHRRQGYIPLGPHCKAINPGTILPVVNHSFHALIFCIFLVPQPSMSSIPLRQR